MPPADIDLIHHTRINATVREDSRYAYTTHTYYGWRQEVIEQHVWRRGFKPIGAGSFGAVYREECVEGARTGDFRAVKHIQKPTASQQGKHLDYGRELEAIARFSRKEYEPFFVRSEGWYEDEDTVCIIMELVPHGSLQEYIVAERGLPESETILLMRQLLQGTSFMHREGYTHRDLKPQNMLVVEASPHWKIKIADFGLSKRILQDASSLRTSAGTPGFMAPEVLGHNWYNDSDSDESDDDRVSYTNAVDMWAVGVIVFYLLTGVLPFPGHSHKLLRKYVQGKATFPVGPLEAKAIAATGLHFIRELLAPDPEGRPSAESSVGHPWLKTSDHISAIASSTQPSTSLASAQWSAYGIYSERGIGTPQLGPMGTRLGDDSGYQTRDLPSRGNVKTESRSLTASRDMSMQTRLHIPFSSAVRQSLFSPSSNHLMLAYGSYKRASFAMWDVDNGKQIYSRESMGLPLMGPGSLAFTPDGKRFAYPAGEHVVLCDTTSGKKLRRVAPSPKAGFFRSGKSYATHHTELTFLPDGILVVFNPMRYKVAVFWDVISGRQLLERSAPWSASWSATMEIRKVVSPDGRLWSVKDEPITLEHIDIDGGGRVFNVLGDPPSWFDEAIFYTPQPFAFSHDSQTIAVGDNLGYRSKRKTTCVRLVDIQTTRETKQLHISDFDLPGCMILELAFSPQGTHIIVLHVKKWGVDRRQDRHQAVSIINIATGARVAVVEDAWFFALSTDGNRLATQVRGGSPGDRERPYGDIRIYDMTW